MNGLSSYAIIIFIAGVILFSAIKKRDVFARFTEGVSEGFATAVNILPAVCAMMIAVSVMKAGGLYGVLIDILAPLARLVGLPEGALPVFVIRPFSGSGALAVLASTLAEYGADSETGRAACIIMGSSETLFYTMSVYCAGAKIKRTRYTAAAGILSSFAGLVCAAILC